MGIFIAPRGTTAVQGIPMGRLRALELRPSGGFQQPTSGTVKGDGSQRTFVWATAPNAIAVDGAVIQKVSSDGTVNWTGTTTTILTIGPTFDIFGLA